MDQSARHPRAVARDAALARLKRSTRVTVVGATALAGGVAALSAHSFPGHKANSAAVRSTTRPTHGVTRARQPTTAPAPTPSDDQSQPAAPVPVQTTAPPVATSGNS